MRPLKAYENGPGQWSVKFRVEPDGGLTIFRRFHYGRSEDGEGWEGVSWSDDAEHPAYADFDPDEYDDNDDMGTLEEEELLAAESENEGELDDLNAVRRPHAPGAPDRRLSDPLPPLRAPLSARTPGQ